jgi:hypothetical protein
MKALQSICGLLFMAAFAYCGWRCLLLGVALREKLIGKPESLISIFNNRKKSR